MTTVRIHFDEVYHRLADVREYLDILQATLPCQPVEAQTLIRMGGGFHRHSGQTDWYADIVLDEDITDATLAENITALPFTTGITAEKRAT